MLSRRTFLLGGIGAIAPAMATCTNVPPELISVQDGKKLEDVLEHGLDLLQLRDYDGARSWLYSHKNKAMLSTDRGQSMFSVQFLYALSNIPEGTVFNGQLQRAGEELTDLLGKLRSSPEHVEWMHDDLSRLFRIPEYAQYKAQCTRLRGRFQMFPFVICLVEQDYDGARTALSNALPHLKAEEQHSVNYTLQVLADRAMRTNNHEKQAQYVTLYATIK